MPDFDRILQGVSKVTLKGGVVGKVTAAVIVVSIALATVSWSVHNIWLSAGALLAIFILSFTFLWRLINFADRHPQAALLEGAEFLVHEQIIHAGKTLPPFQIEPLDRVQPEVIEGPAANPQLALEPDQEVELLEQPGGNP